MLTISRVKVSKPEDFDNPLQEKVFELLEDKNITYSYVDNDSVSSMEECSEIETVLDVEIRKTIVLCNRKKTQFYLLVMPSNKSFNTKDFCEKIGCERLSFASPERMEALLDVKPGSATIMSLLNDKNDMVQLVLDKEITENEWFGCNTGNNTCHLKIKTSDLMNTIIPATQHTSIVVKL